jgi:hypothetical protein
VVTTRYEGAARVALKNLEIYLDEIPVVLNRTDTEDHAVSPHGPVD